MAAALIEMVPERTASTSSGVADFWIFSIWLMVALLRRAARATSSRDRAIDGSLAAPSSPLVSGGAMAASSAAAWAASSAARAAMISFLRRASTPRW